MQAEVITCYETQQEESIHYWRDRPLPTFFVPMQGLEKTVSRERGWPVYPKTGLVITYASLLIIGTILTITFWCGANPQHGGSLRQVRPTMLGRSVTTAHNGTNLWQGAV